MCAIAAMMIAVLGSASGATLAKEEKEPPQETYDGLRLLPEREVALVVVGGDPLYGDVALMQALKSGDHEVIDTGCGYQKAIDVTTERAQVDKGRQNLEEIREALRVGFGTLKPAIRAKGPSPIYMCADSDGLEALRRAPNLTYFDSTLGGLVSTLELSYRDK